MAPRRPRSTRTTSTRRTTTRATPAIRFRKPYWESDIIPELKTGKTVLIAAHGNSLRAIVKMLDGLTEEEIAKVNIPTAMPLVYELDDDFKPIKKGGEYLDPEAAAAGAAAVAAQGQK